MNKPPTGTMDDMVKGEPVIPHLKVGEKVKISGSDFVFEVVMTTKLCNRTLRPMPGFKMVYDY